MKLNKIICCVHDKKGETYDAFMMFNNLAEAMRAFQISCEKNEIFQKWPEDYEFLKCVTIIYQNGEEDGGFETAEQSYEPIAQATDFVHKNEKSA